MAGKRFTNEWIETVIVLAVPRAFSGSDAAQVIGLRAQIGAVIPKSINHGFNVLGCASPAVNDRSTFRAISEGCHGQRGSWSGMLCAANSSARIAKPSGMAPEAASLPIEKHSLVRVISCSLAWAAAIARQALSSAASAYRDSPFDGGTGRDKVGFSGACGFSASGIGASGVVLKFFTGSHE